jgi:hypothetical protein
LQRAYDDFVAQGSASPAAAIQVGQAIERLDIKDLADRGEVVTHADVAAVFANLTAGSERRLAAFSR